MMRSRLEKSMMLEITHHRCASYIEIKQGRFIIVIIKHLEAYPSIFSIIKFYTFNLYACNDYQFKI